MTAIYLSGDVNITYLHIPKTAGTSIFEWLKHYRRNSIYKEYEGHPKLSEILDNLPEGNSPNFTFTVVRNPWDRAVSAYHFFHTYGQKQKFQKELLELNNLTEWLTFDEFVFYINDLIVPPSMNAGDEPKLSQSSFVDRPIDYVIKYENLHTEFLEIHQHYSNWNPLPHYLVTDHYHYSKYYNTATRNAIYNLFRDDIERWDFKF